MTKYLQVNFKDGKLFEYSKEEKEGFSEHKNENGEVKGYRKYYNEGVSGELISVNERLNEFLPTPTKELVITLKEGDDYLNINLQMFMAGNKYSSFCESFIKQVSEMSLGEVYHVYPYNFIPKDSYKDRAVIGISVRKDNNKGEKLEKLGQKYIKKDGTITEGVIPAVEWKEKRGKMVANEEGKQDFLYDVLSKALKTLGSEDAPTDKKEVDKAVKPEKEFSKKEKVNKKEVLVEEDENDDLPF